MSEDLTKKLPKRDDVNVILTAVEDLGTAIRTSHENLVTWVSNIDSRLRGLEQKVEERLYDTRPIWEKVLADISQLREGQSQLEKTVRVEAGEIKNSLIDLYRGQNSVNDALLALHRNYHQFDERLNKIESICNQQNPST